MPLLYKARGFVLLKATVLLPFNVTNIFKRRSRGLLPPIRPTVSCDGVYTARVLNFNRVWFSPRAYGLSYDQTEAGVLFIYNLGYIHMPLHYMARFILCIGFKIWPRPLARGTISYHITIYLRGYKIFICHGYSTCDRINHWHQMLNGWHVLGRVHQFWTFFYY